MVILTSSPSTATSVDKKGQSVLRGIQDFLCFWLWPHSPTTTSTAFPSTLHNPFSTHAGHALPSLCLYFCLQCLHTSGENCLSNFSSKHPKVIPCQLCLPNRTLPMPPTGTLHKCPVLQWQNKHLPLHRTVSSYVLVSHPTTLTRPSTDWGPWETSMNTKRSVAEQLPVSQKQDPKAGPKAEWRGDSKGKVDSSKAVIFEGETMTPFSEEKRKLGRRAPMDSASLSTDSRGDCSSTHLQSWATSQEERLQTDPNPLNSQVRKREILSDIQLLVASGPATSNPILILCFLCH